MAAAGLCKTQANRKIKAEYERDDSRSKIYPVRGIKEGREVDDKSAPEQYSGGDYQTARVAYANWPCAVFGFWGATTDESGVVEATAFTGFTRTGADPCP